VTIRFEDCDLDAIAAAAGRVCVLVPDEGNLGQEARRVNRLTRGAIARMREAEDGLKTGDLRTLAWPAGMAARAVDVVVLPRRCR
jgi:leucyl aminopeptidase